MMASLSKSLFCLLSDKLCPGWHKRRTALQEQRVMSPPARDCWPSSRWVWPLSCWMSLPGSSPVSSICTHLPTPYVMRQSFRMAASSLVQPGEGVKFHLQAPALSGPPSLHDCCYRSLLQPRVPVHQPRVEQLTETLRLPVSGRVGPGPLCLPCSGLLSYPGLSLVNELTRASGSSDRLWR